MWSETLKKRLDELLILDNIDIDSKIVCPAPLLHPKRWGQNSNMAFLFGLYLSSIITSYTKSQLVLRSLWRSFSSRLHQLRLDLLAGGWRELWVVPVCVEYSAANSPSGRKKRGFERHPPTSEWALQIPPLKWAYFLTALLQFCMDPPESSLHINTNSEVGKKRVMKKSPIPDNGGGCERWSLSFCANKAKTSNVR